MIATLATLLMTRANLGPKAAKAASVAIIVALCALALWLAYSWAWDRGRDHERDRWEAAVAKIEKADAKADDAGTAKAAETKGTIDAQNDAANDAARNSADPLRDALSELRRQGSGQGD